MTYAYGTSSASNNNGRLVSLADGASSESYTYDLMGRITNVSKTITGAAGNPYNLVYAYNNASQLTSLTYPSGRVVTQAYDAIGRTSSIASGATTYLSGVSFNGAGQPLAFNYGNSVAATFSYNQRLQLASLRYVNGSTDLLNLAYSYGAANNGQIKDIKYYTSPGVEDPAKTQNYEYDAWSRLKKAYTTDLVQPNTWRLEWDYDRFGNRKNQNLTGGNTSVTAPQLSISETTNRITTVGYVYDAAGNMTNDSLHTYTYDAENRIKTVDSTAATYTYSGPLRVKKVAGATTTISIFSGTKVIAEYVNGSLNKEYVYSGSALLATHEGATLRYHHPDHLGTRVDSDTAGNWTRKFGSFPFGESWYEDLQGGGVASKLKFTSYERDSESGLDQAMFRYNSPRLGRFFTPDPLPGSTLGPQSLNRYTYALNDPVNLADPLGLAPWGFDCLIDGFASPCSLLRGLLISGAAVPCPAYIDCNFVTAGADGTLRVLRTVYVPGPRYERGDVNSLEYTIGVTTGHFELQVTTYTFQTPYWNDPNAYEQIGPFRTPDFAVVNATIALPNKLTGTLVGLSFSLAQDRYGRFYWSPFAGVSLGKSLAGYSFSVGFGWLNQGSIPSQGQLTQFLTGHSFNAGLGALVGGSIAWTPGAGTATVLGVYSPQVGASYNYSWQIGP